MPLVSVRALVEPKSVNLDTRTVDVVISAGVQVQRYNWMGDYYYMEELGMDPKNIRMDRLESGAAPVLNSHNQWDLASVLGVVERAWIKDGLLWGTLRFSKRDDVDVIFKDIADGIIKNVSVGYSRYGMELVSESDAEMPVYRVTDWEPTEVSMVAVPADPDAGVRKADLQTNPCIIHGARAHVSKKENDMTEEEKKAAAAAAAAEAARAAEENDKRVAAAAAEARAEASKAERQRITDIHQLVRTHNLSDEFAEKMVSEAKPIEEVRNLILDELARASDAKAVQNRSGGSDKDKDTQERMVAMEGALMHRANPTRFKLEGRSREYVGMSLLEMARECVERSGVSTRGMTKMQVAERALHSTSDFPILLSNVAGKTLRKAYDEQQQTFRPFVRVTTAPDFKPVTRVQLGEAPQLVKVGENGEFTRGTIGEGKEAYKLDTYGKVVAITRQVIVNDDLDAFTRVPEAMGRQAANLESDLVWGVILNNLAMGDGVNLFHANHKNLTTGAGGALSATDLSSLNAMRKAMRSQKGLDGKTILNLTLSHIIVPTSLETVADQIISPDMRATKAGDVNVYSGKLQSVVEPRLDALATYGATAWYGVAANSQIDLIELAYLEGENGPVIETRNGFDVDGVEIKIRHDVAAAPIDWRGFQRNNGA